MLFFCIEDTGLFFDVNDMSRFFRFLEVLYQLVFAIVVTYSSSLLPLVNLEEEGEVVSGSISALQNSSCIVNVTFQAELVAHVCGRSGELVMYCYCRCEMWVL